MNHAPWCTFAHDGPCSAENEMPHLRAELREREAMLPELDRGVVPPGRYAQGERSPIVHVFLCAYCAGFAPITDDGYEGFLSGRCNGCGCESRELHRFEARIDSAHGCKCSHGHAQVFGDLNPTAVAL